MSILQRHVLRVGMRWRKHFGCFQQCSLPPPTALSHFYSSPYAPHFPGPNFNRLSFLHPNFLCLNFPAPTSQLQHLLEFCKCLFFLNQPSLTLLTRGALTGRTHRPNPLTDQTNRSYAFIIFYYSTLQVLPGGAIASIPSKCVLKQNK